MGEITVFPIITQKSYILGYLLMAINSKCRSSVTKVHTLPGADSHSDNKLLVGNLRMKLQDSRAKKMGKRMEIVDRESLGT